MNPLLHWGNKGIIRGFHFLDPLGGVGSLDEWPTRTNLARSVAQCSPRMQQPGGLVKA